MFSTNNQLDLQGEHTYSLFSSTEQCPVPEPIYFLVNSYRMELLVGKVTRLVLSFRLHNKKKCHYQSSFMYVGVQNKQKYHIIDNNKHNQWYVRWQKLHLVERVWRNHTILRISYDPFLSLRLPRDTRETVLWMATHLHFSAFISLISRDRSRDNKRS